MSELTKSLSDAYALPWTIKHYGAFDAIFSASGLRLCYVSRPDTERKRAAMSHIIKCANVMPECIKVLRQARDGLYRACMNCTNGELHDCPVCRANGVDERIDALLAKLEGEVDDYERVD